MKKSVIYVHGGDSFAKYNDFIKFLRTVPLRDLPATKTDAGPESVVEKEHWKNTLAEDLGEEFLVYKPAMPNKQNARYQEWKIWFERYLDQISGDVILVGCSLGGMFLAKYLCEEKIKVAVSQLHLLASPGGEYESDGGDCAEFLFSSEKLGSWNGNQVKKVYIWHSEDDFVVPFVEALWYQSHLPQAKMKLFTDKNHFLGPELPELALEIKKNH
jgi:uncharacterized protein